MSDSERPDDWGKTTFDGSRCEQLHRAQTMTVRQRLVALDELTELSERMQVMPKQSGSDAGDNRLAGVHEPRTDYHSSVPGAGNEIVLDGCTPTPLANYLKALGVLRLLSAKYPDIRGFWRGDKFVLRTSLDRSDIERFFLDDYEPTPLVAPWGARSGFYSGSSEKTARVALSKIELSDNERLESFQDMIRIIRNVLLRHGIHQKPSDEEKLELLRICRAELPDHLVQWLDTCYVLSGESRKFPPLLGTGGNEGSGSYVSGFTQQVAACVAEGSHNAALGAALFNDVLPDASTDQTPGHFSPVHAGGVNASTGFEDKRAQVNPWDYILSLEGTLILAGAATRRIASNSEGVMSYPFTVHAASAGFGSLAEGDESEPRGEIWLPIWPQPATYAEIHALMTEGRVALGKKPARDALDFVRAVHRLGGYRGIQSFQRFGLLKRNGRSYFATSLSHVEVSDQPRSRWLDDLDKHQWLDRFRQFARGDTAANRFHVLRKRLEDMLFALSGHEPGKAEAQALLTLLGETQSALSSSQKAREAVRPVPRLSEQWVIAAEDETPAFRVAKAMAGLGGVGDEPLPLRAQLYPVHRKYDEWMSPETGEKARIYTGQKGRLPDTLRALLERRLWLAEKLEMKDKPLASPAGATLEDVATFLRDDHMDARIAALLPGLCLCEIPEETNKSADDGMLPAAFGLLKLALTPDRTLHSLAWLGAHDRLPIPGGMVTQLVSGNHGNRAVYTAWRRLHASGLNPVCSMNGLPGLGNVHPLRAAAALLIPLRYSATRALARQLLKTPELGTNTA